MAIYMRLSKKMNKTIQTEAFFEKIAKRIQKEITEVEYQNFKSQMRLQFEEEEINHLMHKNKTSTN